MRIISTFCLLLFALIVRGQADFTILQPKEIIVKTSCTTRIATAELISQRIPDTNSLSKILAGRISCLVAPPAKKDTITRTARIRMCCHQTIVAGNEPLIIIDGVPADNKLMGYLNPNDIRNLEILKGESATAIYGSGVVNGVICITMKQSRFRKFIVKDFLDGSPIAGATVSFINIDMKDTLWVASNDSGLVVTDKLKPATVYQIRVSAVGYKTVYQSLENSYGLKEKDIQLVREVMICDNVLIRTYPVKHYGCPHTCLLCRVGGITITLDSVKSEEKLSNPLSLHVYPNPVQRGAALNLVFNKEKGIVKSVRILNIDGREMERQSLEMVSGKTHFQLSTDSHWAAGIYFVQLICEKGRVLASDKIIIQ